jgi:hypothetical protein
MKKTGFNFWLVLSIVLLSAQFGFAQMPGGGVNFALNKLFGSASNFTAVADVAVFDKAQKEYMRAPMNFAVLNGKVRVDIDLGQVKSKELPASTIVGMKKVGLDRIASVVRPDKQTMYIIYPLVKSYVNMPMSKEDIEASGHTLKMEKVAMGKETVASHPSTKNRVTIKDSKGGVALDALTWNASDLKDFPVQIQMKENGNTTVMRFSQIKFVPPDAKLFEAPAGFKLYDDPQTLMLSAASKNNAPPKK